MKRSIFILFVCALLKLSFISWRELQGGDYNGWIVKDGVYYVWSGYGDRNFSEPPSHCPSNGVKFQITNGNFLKLS